MKKIKCHFREKSTFFRKNPGNGEICMGKKKKISESGEIFGNRFPPGFRRGD